eukprot:1148480-Pelagomonas_calceolata.AAC.6
MKRVLQMSSCPKFTGEQQEHGQTLANTQFDGGGLSLPASCWVGNRAGKATQAAHTSSVVLRKGRPPPPQGNRAVKVRAVCLHLRHQVKARRGEASAWT